MLELTNFNRLSVVALIASLLSHVPCAAVCLEVSRATDIVLSFNLRLLYLDEAISCARHRQTTKPSTVPAWPWCTRYLGIVAEPGLYSAGVFARDPTSLFLAVCSISHRLS